MMLACLLGKKKLDRVSQWCNDLNLFNSNRAEGGGRKKKKGRIEIDGAKASKQQEKREI